MMDKKEAKSILKLELQRTKSSKFTELADRVGKTEINQIQGKSGVMYQVETIILWDDPRKNGGDLRVILSIDDGGLWSAMNPLSEDFIMKPDGTVL